MIDGAGKTLLPGLIDAHTHVWPGTLESALSFGVTTELAMFSDPAAAKVLRDQQAAGTATARADMLSAGTLVTAPGGHGTQFGMPIPTITMPAEAQAFIDARLAEGSDYIKIVYDNGHTYGMTLSTNSRETLRALISATHARQKLAVVHIGDLASARDAIDAGADGLVHLYVDQAPDAEFAAFVARHRAFVVPTMTGLKSIAYSSLTAIPPPTSPPRARLSASGSRAYGLTAPRLPQRSHPRATMLPARHAGLSQAS